MAKLLTTTFIVLLIFSSNAQDGALPPDIRQHNLTQFNASLFNPAFSFDRNKPRSVALWSRWQWQTIDTDPSTMFFNYTQRFGAQSSGGIGFFQNNTGLFLNRGGVLNYAFAIPLGEEVNLIFGANVLGYQQELADTRVILGNQPLPFPNNDDPRFIAELAPGLRLQAKSFSMGMSVENALNFDFTNSERLETERIFSGSISNDFPVYLFDELSYVRPILYARSIPNQDFQYGLATLFTTPKFWVQGGYNSFYGVSGGVGATFFKKLSLGALVESGLNEAIQNEDPTFELVLAYHFGEQMYEPKEKEEKLSPEEKMEEIEKQRQQEEAEKERLRLAEEARLAQLEKEAMSKRRAEELAAVKEQLRQDSIAKVARTKEVEIMPNEKYQEVNSAEGLQPGFYLIANVFGTKKYLENFKSKLEAQGLLPKSFYRSVNKFNYVYLARYETIDEARAARASKFGGKYKDALWIFRVRGE
ncbi:Hypothetical protein I595_558 [Croceitalea dokdonensis DOKDO 023]|uniref:SPOR domain-containing protein n=1 Tax=Croceitalea dokdonensis DOKDO 023 TaxID=1300341 RepID=A0A0P7AXV5_9FLAO|nr:PorP/SprF family type IX secretion system membrane protein [Croceitalea dokdonensis]KPM33654.1 Hypothetical protein I595_558 [Croceitalea dokdonensis DOKDO 023]